MFFVVPEGQFDNSAAIHRREQCASPVASPVGTVEQIQPSLRDSAPILNAQPGDKSPRYYQKLLTELYKLRLAL
jgi:hypothetical protein